METETSLRRVVAEFFEIDPGQIVPEFSLSGKRLEGSLARAKLDAAIRRRVGVKCPAVYSARTYGELESAVLGKMPAVQGSSSSSARGSESVPASSTGQRDNSAANAGIACGIDIEMVDDLPQANDYWEEEFYNTCFTPAEIAYCLTHKNPRIHFAARWCAKEALKKCDPAFLNEDMFQIEVTLDNTGMPSLSHRLNGVLTKLPFVVSISHTPTVAVAVVVQQKAPREQAPPPTPGTSTSPDSSPPDSNRKSFSFVPVLLAVIAIAVAVCALIRTFNP